MNLFDAMEPTMDLNRPLSWSSLSTFEWNPEEWYDKYVLGKKPPVSKEMEFGKVFAESCEKRKPLAPVELLSEVEYPLLVKFGKIPMIGYIDSYEPHTALREYKSGKKEWNQKRADEHGQIDAYLLMLFITHKVRPEDINCKIQWIPTKENGDFSIDFVRPIKVHTFETKRTMADILRFASRVSKTWQAMQDFASHKTKGRSLLDKKLNKNYEKRNINNNTSIKRSLGTA